MSNKIFGITVKENIPYVRTIFLLDNKIENSLTNENHFITGMTKIINIDDDSITETDFENKLIITKNDFKSEEYNGEFHLFVNEEYTNGCYTTGEISYINNTIQTTIPFINKYNIEEIIKNITFLQQINDNAKEIGELKEQEENLEDEIKEIEEVITPEPIIPEPIVTTTDTEEDILHQIKELNTNISNIDTSILNYKKKLEEKTELDNEKTTIENKIEEKEEETKQMINDVLGEEKLEELKKEINDLLDTNIDNNLQTETDEDKELKEKITNTQNEINSLEKLLESTTGLVYNKIKQTTEQNKQNEIIAQEKINMDNKIKQLADELDNLKLAEENTKSLNIQEQIENLKSTQPKVSIETKQIRHTNTMSVVTNTQSRITDELITKIQKVIPKFKELQNKLRIHNNEITGGGNKEGEDKIMIECIKSYIGIVQYIIYRPIFYKLTSLKCDDYKVLLTNYKIPLYDGKTTGVNKTRVTRDYLDNMYINLLSFMFVNMSSFKDTNLTDKLFYENNKGLQYEQLLNKYKLYNENFNQLLNLTEDETKSNPTLMVYISEFINLLTNLLKNDNVNNSDNMINYKYNLYETLLTYITSQYDLLNTIVDKYFPLLELPDNEEFRIEINKYIERMNNNNIIGYLKIRNDEDKKEKYNNRFKISINENEEPNKIMIDYMDDNIPYYVFDKEEDEYVLTPEIKELARTTQNYTLNNELNVIDIEKYKYSYLFGPFAHIFEPHVKNEYIAKNMTVIKDKIKENKPIFMIGYGASGAGKTSSLIYFKKNQENGILINLCNQLGSEGIFNKIELKCKEFYHTTDVGSVENPEIVNVPNNDNGNIEFVFENGNFVLSEEYKHSTHHQYRMINKDRNYIEKETVFKTGTKLGEVIIHLIDTDRFVKATTNNPNSSRSHTLVFVKLIGETNGENKTGNIIIGDFAGVENKFACENPNTIKAFLSVKRDNVKDEQGNEIYVPYYSTEAYKGNPDPLGVIEDGATKGGAISQQCIPKIEVKDPIYDFENPVIRKEWLLPDDMVKFYEDNNNKNLKIAFNVILEYLKQNKENNNKINPEKFKKELELYSNVNANNGSSIEQVINNIEVQLNKLLTKIDVDNKSSRLRASDKTTSTDTFSNKQIIKVFTKNINEILMKNKIPLIKELPFKDYAFRGQMLGPFENAYRGDINNIIKNIREQYESVEILTKIINKYNLEPLVFNALKENIFKKYGNYNNLLELLKDLELETSCRQENSNVICENRREEGYFINNSLEKVREVIKKILFEKNKNSINITPNFIDICFKNYCPQHSNCFNFDILNETTIEQDKTGSVIFDEIYKELKEIKVYEAPQKMYEDIIISIFCVFNISRGANNPPPTPYLDINKLKLLFYYEDIVNNASLQDKFIEEATKIIDKILLEFKDKVGDLTTIKSNISKQKSIFDLFNSMKTKFSEGNIDKKTFNQLYKFYIKEFIDMIDKSNAVSAIGTLEFLDQIAKFNTIKSICNSQEIKEKQPHLIKRFNDNNIMKHLYEGFDGGMKKKYTKKNRLYKEIKNTKRNTKRNAKNK